MQTITNERNKILIHTIVGCSTIILGSFIRIPFFPVPFTMQTFAIFMLALLQTPRQALLSTLTFLGLATIGLPVFGGRINPLWIAGKCGGFLTAFPIAAYVTAKLSQKWSLFASVFAGQAIIYLFGFIWLAPLFGAKVAFTQGIALFLISDFIKNLFVIMLIKQWRSE